MSARFQRLGEVERGLAAELDDNPEQRAAALLDPDDLDHVLGGQRLEIEPVRGVVIGRDGLRVAVDHDRFDAGFAQAVGGMDAAIIELDALADPVRPAAEDDDLAPVARIGLAFRRRHAVALVAGIHDTGSARRIRRRRCRCACRPGAARAAGAASATSASASSASLPRRRSEKPICFSRRNAGRVPRQPVRVAPAPRPRRSRGCGRGTTARTGRRRGFRRW